jgi:steroid 5-alpha reductase family enzyme
LGWLSGRLHWLVDYAVAVLLCLVNLMVLLVTRIARRKFVVGCLVVLWAVRTYIHAPQLRVH